MIFATSFLASLVVTASVEKSLKVAYIGSATAIVVAVIAAGIAAAMAWRRYQREKKDQQDMLLNAPFGELANIYQHYCYAAAELPSDTADSKVLKKRLTWAKYGEVHATKEISEYGFLSGNDIAVLLQLKLRIRNNDSFFDQLLTDTSTITYGDLGDAKKRMEYALVTAENFLTVLVEKRPDLQPVVDRINSELGRPA